MDPDSAADPEVNARHWMRFSWQQKSRLRYGFIVTNPTCPRGPGSGAQAARRSVRLEKIFVVTLQGLSAQAIRALLPGHSANVVLSQWAEEEKMESGRKSCSGKWNGERFVDAAWASVRTASRPR